MSDMLKVRKLMLVFLVVALLLFVTGCVGESNGADKKRVTILVGAAAGTADAISEIEPLFEKVSGIDVDLQFSASGPIKEQIKSGAGIDVYITASKKDIDELVSLKLVEEDEVLLTNKLILAKTKGSDVKGVDDLVGVDYVAIGEPGSVPVGKYATEALKNLGLYDALKGKLTFAKDVTQVLNWVESGNAEAGFVYYSDFVRSAGGVEMVEEVDQGVYSRILFPMGLVSASEKKTEAREFMGFLRSDEAKAVFVKYGFGIPE